MSQSTYVRNKDFYNFCYQAIVIILPVAFYMLYGPLDICPLSIATEFEWRSD